MQPLLTQRQCAEALALSERTLERFRVSGVGPKFVRCGKSIRYRLSDVEAWFLIVKSTQGRGPFAPERNAMATDKPELLSAEEIAAFVASSYC